MAKVLWECTGLVYVLAEDIDEARALASRHSQPDEWSAEEALSVEPEWSNALPYQNEPGEDITCRQILAQQEADDA